MVSSNVVGYQKLTIAPDGYVLLASPFVEVGTGDSAELQTFAINDMFGGEVDQITAGRNGSQGDQIQVWDSVGQTYDTYFFSSLADGGSWATLSTPRVSTADDIPAANGYWYLNRSNNEFELIVSGEVSKSEVSVTLDPGYTLVCNPYPAPLPLNNEDIDWATSGATAGRNGSQGDQIQVWNAEEQSYDTYFFSSMVTGGAWALLSTPRIATTDSVPSGQGFWYLNRSDSAFSITLKSPLATAD